MTIQAGQILSAARLNALWTLYDDPPMGQFRQTAGQAIATGTFTAVTFGAEDHDNRSGHSTSSNTSRYVCQYPGRYQLSGKVAYVFNATGQRVSAWYVNGTVLSGSQISIRTNPDASREMQLPAATMTALLALNDYVELYTFQDSGGSLNTSVADGKTQSLMHVRWVGSS